MWEGNESPATPEPWDTKIACALCTAGRPAFGFSIALAVVAGAALWLETPGGAASRVALEAVVAVGAAQAYLAGRVEFDRWIFEAFGSSPAPDLNGFDAALSAFGWTKAGRTGRSLAERVDGIARLVRRASYLFAAQIGITLAIPWLPR